MSLDVLLADGGAVIAVDGLTADHGVDEAWGSGWEGVMVVQRDVGDQTEVIQGEDTQRVGGGVLDAVLGERGA